MRTIQEFSIDGRAMPAFDETQARSIYNAMDADLRERLPRSTLQQPLASAFDIYARRRTQARGETVEAPIESEGIYARRARQVRAARAGAAPEVDATASILTPAGAARVFASRKTAWPGIVK